jgi:hypothetical protein
VIAPHGKKKRNEVFAKATYLPAASSRTLAWIASNGPYLCCSGGKPSAQAEAHMAGIRMAPRQPMAAEETCDLQRARVDLVLGLLLGGTIGLGLLVSQRRKVVERGDRASP